MTHGLDSCWLDVVAAPTLSSMLLPQLVGLTLWPIEESLLIRSPGTDPQGGLRHQSLSACTVPPSWMQLVAAEHTRSLGCVALAVWVPFGIGAVLRW